MAGLNIGGVHHFSIGVAKLYLIIIIDIIRAVLLAVKSCCLQLGGGCGGHVLLYIIFLLDHRYF
jgi:hypothetical protein